MQTDGSFCASGGPYVIAHQCSSSDIRLIMIGIFGALIAAGFYAGGSAGLGSRAASAGLVLWAALFGTLGWNFLSAGRAGASGMLFTGAPRRGPPTVRAGALSRARAPRYRAPAGSCTWTPPSCTSKMKCGAGSPSQ